MTFRNYVIILIFSALKFTVSQFCNENEIFSPVINPCNSCDVQGWCPQEVGFGCDCFPGYLRNSYGSCVPPEACDALPTERSIPDDINVQCGQYEVFNSCGSACPPTCEGPRPGPCTLQCVAGCFCEQGYIRRGKECVPVSQCIRPPQKRPRPPQRITPRSYGYAPPPSAHPPPFPPAFPPPLPPAFPPRPPAFPPHPPQFPPRPPAFPPRPPAFPPRPPPFPPRPPVFPPRPPFPRPPPPPLPLPPPVYPPLPPLPPLPPALPPPLPPRFPPPLPPLPPPLPPKFPPLPPKYPPPTTDARGCPNRNKCNKYCRSIGQTVGFCVGENFLKCNCLS